MRTEEDTRAVLANPPAQRKSLDRGHVRAVRALFNPGRNRG